MFSETDFPFLFLRSLSLVRLQKPWGHHQSKIRCERSDSFLLSETLPDCFPSILQSLADTCPSFILPRLNFLFSHPSTNDLHPFIAPPSLLNPSLLHYLSFPPSMGCNELKKIHNFVSMVFIGVSQEPRRWRKWNRNCDTVHLHTLKQNNGSSWPSSSVYTRWVNS